MVVIQSPFVRPQLPTHYRSFPEFVLENFDNWQNATALTDSSTGKFITFRDFKERCAGAAWAWQQKFGMEKGDVMGVLMGNYPEVVVALVSAMAIGGIYTGCNPMYTLEEIGNQFSDADVKYLFTTAALYPKIAAAMAQNLMDSHRIRHIFILDLQNMKSKPDDPRILPIDALLGSRSHSFPHVEINAKDDIAFLPYTSGTTGLPKGAMLSHYGLIRLCSVPSIGSTHKDNVITILPLFHIGGFFMCMHPLTTGAHVVVMPKFEVGEYFKLLSKFDITIILSVPSVLLSLTRDSRAEKLCLDRVHTVAFGSAPAGEELMKALVKKFPNVKVISQLYGMTENGVITAVPPLEIRRIPLLSCGMLVPGVIAKFMSLQDPQRELDVGETGELWVKGDAFMKGYLNKPDKTREIIDTQGWLHTGDIGYCDAAGFIYITDRLKELIKYKGYQVPPAEIEDVILKHPAVQEVGVTGAADPENFDVGELATAFVTLKPSFHESENLKNEIKATVAEHLAPYKHLRGGVIVMNELPKTASGKVMRRLLKDSIRKNTRAKL